jgi:origin recognition complex subunit 1
LGLMSQLQPVYDYLIVPEKDYMLEASNSTQLDTTRAASKASELKAARSLGLALAATELAEAGIIGVEARHGERVGRVRLGVGEDEVRLALGEDESVKGLGFGS